MKKVLAAMCVIGALLAPIACEADFRESVLLNEGWKMAVVQSMNETAVESPSLDGVDWKAVDVPHFGIWDYTWWQRSFNIPRSMRGKSIKLRFEAVAFKAIVFVNGNKVGEHFGARMPFEVDITDLAKIDGPNDVLVGVLNQRKGANEGRLSVDAMGDTNGIWQDVSLVSYPKVYVEDVWVIPSFRKRSLSLEVTIRNESDRSFTGELLNQVLESGRPVKRFKSQSFTVGARDSVVLRLSIPWENPKLWSPEMPNLYWLQSRLARNGVAADSTKTRFGFREVWVEGDHFMLNGRRLNLRGDSGFPAATYPHPQIHDLILNGGWDGRPSIKDREGTRRWYKERFLLRKSWGLNYSRDHIAPPHPDYLHVADEVGYLIEPEHVYPWGMNCVDMGGVDRSPVPSVWNLEPYAFPQYREWIKRDRNHPSVVAWSVENEYLMHYTYLHSQYTSRALELLVRLCHYVHRLDPTRPLTFEGDGDLAGSYLDDGSSGPADTTSWHYHREVTTGYTLVPNTYYWLLDPKETPSWSRKKPLWVGEALSADTLDKWDQLTIFQGESVYKDPSPTSQAWCPDDDKGAYVAQAFSDSVQMQMEAWRYIGVNWGNWSYWNRADATYVPSQVVRRITRDSAKSCAQLAVFVKEYDHNFYSGETITRELPVYNDMFHDAKLLLHWATSVDGKVVEHGKMSLSLKSGESRRLHVALHLPKVSTRKSLAFRLRLEEPGTKNRFEDEKRYTVFPAKQSTIKTGARVAVFDPIGKSSNIINKLGLSYASITDLRKISREKSDVLILGKGAMTDKLLVEELGKVEEFVADGGRLVVFEQDAFSPSFFSMNLKVKETVPATMAFGIAHHHPVMSGVQADDLKFWRGDHVVCRKPLVKPDYGNIRTLIESGTGQGLIVTPLLEVKKGKGTALFSQLDLTEKCGKEPAADLLTRNMLAYAAAYHEKPLSEAGIIAGASSPVAEFLNSIAIDAESIQGRLSQANLAKFACVIVDASDGGNILELQGNFDLVKRYLTEGGKLLIHGLRPGDQGLVESLTGAKLAPRQVIQKDCAWKVAPHPLLDGISNFELWYGRHKNYVRAQGRKTLDTGWLIENGGDACFVEPGAFVVTRVGNGSVIIDQVLWEGSDDQSLGKRRRYISTLLTNLGVSLALERAVPEKVLHGENELFFVDLRPHANMGFKDEVAGDGMGGWSDEGNNDLKYFPVGKQAFGGILFDVIDPRTNNGKSCVEPFFLKERAVRGIKVDKRLQVLYFLYGGTFTVADMGEEMACYEVVYQDGQRAKVPIRYSMEIDDWYSPVPESADVKKAWEGDNGFHSPVFITLYEWRNPHSEKVITSVELVLPPGSPSRYGLIAITGLLSGAGSTKAIQAIPTGVVKNGRNIMVNNRAISFLRQSNDPIIGDPKVEFGIDGPADASRLSGLKFTAELEDDCWMNLGFTSDDGRVIITQKDQIRALQGRREYSIDLTALKWTPFEASYPAGLGGRITSFWISTSQDIGSAVKIEDAVLNYGDRM